MKRPFFVLTINWFIAAALMVAAYLVCYRIPLSGIAPNPSLSHLHVIARSIAMLLLVLSALSAILLVVATIVCMRDPSVSGRYIAWVGFACVTPFFGYIAASFSTWPIHRAALTGVANRAQPLVTAIAAYTRDHGEPPVRLVDLTPAHLAAIPTTGLAGYPDFFYTRFSTKTARRVLWWYDLGARHGRTMTAQWIYPDGDTSHAILAIELDGDDLIVNARPDRMAINPPSQTFTRAAWDTRPIDRQGLVPDFLQRFPLEGRTAEELTQLLGAPDGRRVLVSTPWELWLHSWPTQSERFFYWPTHAYPTVLDGRAVITVDGWAYARE